MLKNKISHTNLLLLFFTIPCVLFSLAVRVVYRGPYYPGWDLIGPALGHYLVSTQTFWEALRRVFHSLRHFQYWNHGNSLIYTFIPGYLESIWPWEYWGHLLTFCFFLLTLFLIIRVAKLPFKKSWVILLAWGASPALLSFSVAGYPYITGFLTHIIAIWLTLNQRIRQNWVLSLFLCLAINELSWNFYELSKTLFIVFLWAAIILRGVPSRTRVVWIIVSIVQIAMILKFSHANVDYLVQNQHQFEVIATVKNMLLHMSDALFVSYRLDFPILLVLAFLSFFFFKTNRWFLFGLFIVQVGLIFWLAKNSFDLRPRRFLLVECYAILVIANIFRYDEIRSRFTKIARVSTIGLLLIGSVWQIVNLVQYTQVPIQKRLHPMPFTMSTTDYHVPAESVDWFLEMRSRVDAGEKLLLLYNLNSYSENTTDPAGVLERLYLYLGHKRFVESIFVFGSQKCRYSCVPIHPVEEIEAVLNTIHAGEQLSPEIITVYFERNLYSLMTSPYASEWSRVFTEIRKRFIIRLESPKEAKFIRCSIKERPPGKGFIIQTLSSTYERNSHGQTLHAPFNWNGFPLDLIWTDPLLENPYLVKRPWEGDFTLKISGLVHIFETGLYQFISGSSDRLVLNLNGQTIINNTNNDVFELAEHRFILENDEYPLEIIYTNSGNKSCLLLDLVQIHGNIFRPVQEPQFQPVRLDNLFPTGMKGWYYRTTDWTGEHRAAGQEIQLGESLETIWTDTPGPSQKPFGSNQAFSLRLTGEMVILEPGIYHFELGSDDGSLLYLDDSLLIDNGGNHPYREEQAVVYLNAGKIAFQLDYFDVMADAQLRLTVKFRKNDNDQIIK